MKLYKALKNKKGMTIVELMVAMTIFVIVITLAVGGFVAISRLSSQAYTMTNVQQNGRILIEQLTRLSRSADEVNITGTAPFQTVSFRNGTEWVCFNVVGSPTVVKKYNNIDCTGNGFSLTSSEVKVNKMTFVRKEGIPPYLKIGITLESATPAFGTSNDTIDLNTAVVLEGT